MIGQRRILSKIDRWKDLPRFMIFSGLKGCGKKTLAKELGKRFECEVIIIGTKIDEIRNLIKIANESESKILFVIDNGDRMSLGAKNTLLKVAEEAPNNSYIILTTENKELVLPTLISRGEVISFDDYDEEDHKEYCKENGYEYQKINTYVFPNLSYYQLMTKEEAINLYELANKVINHIREASGPNSFKILEKIKIKEEDEGFEFTQFLFTLNKLALYRLVEAAKYKDMKEYNLQLAYIQQITKTKRSLVNPLFNKSYIADQLIIGFKSV